MKPSPYNLFFPILDGRIVLAYNTCSGAVAEIERENYPLVQDILAHPDRPREGQAAEFLECLRAGGFVIPDTLDQPASLRLKSRSDRLEGTTLALTVAPTLACNFACDYCFESRSGARMSEETQRALLAFADRRLYHAEGLRVCWFGGEPTLCFAMIEKLQQQLVELAARHKVKLHPCLIVTNGYLMDAAMATRLRELGVQQAQVTLDGPAPAHDRRRKLRNGQGTFERIVDNLSRTADILAVNVRINIDKDNVDSVHEVVALLHERGILGKVKVTFAPITPAGEACADIRERCHDNEDFARIMTRIYRRLAADGIEQISRPRVSSGGICGAVAEGYYVVSPTGLLFKCWEDLCDDAEKSIGSIFSDAASERQRANLEAYRAWQPLALADCGPCAYSPVCMGGCPARGRENPGASRGECATWRYNLGDMLEIAYAAAAAKQQKP